MLIHTGNEHPNMQANKLNAKYHLHVQHSTVTQTLGKCIKDKNPTKGTKVMYLKKMQNIEQQVLRYKAKVQNPNYIETEYKQSHVITNKQKH